MYTFIVQTHSLKKVSIVDDGKKKKKEIWGGEERLKALTNDLINGLEDYRLGAHRERKWSSKYFLKAVNKFSVLS